MMSTRLTRSFATILFASLVVACGEEARPKRVSTYRGEMQAGSITVTSPAFAPGGPLPAIYARGDGNENRSPPLRWTGLPDDTVEVALVVDDADSPGTKPFVHWVVYRLPPGAGDVPAGFSVGARLLQGAGGPLQGGNGFGETGWGGPDPAKRDGVHHYSFWIHALNAKVNLPSGASYDDLIGAMKGHVLAQGFVVATYER